MGSGRDPSSCIVVFGDYCKVRARSAYRARVLFNRFVCDIHVCACHSRREGEKGVSKVNRGVTTRVRAGAHGGEDPDDDGVGSVSEGREGGLGLDGGRPISLRTTQNPMKNDLFSTKW